MNLKIPKKTGLYIHLPWCIKKCPYCDFNSHQIRENFEEKNYVEALCNDFEFELNRLDQTRIISSIFIGGGTPSLFSAESIDKLLRTIKSNCGACEDLEITLEANPGAADESRFEDYRQAGVNRLSIGIQSFNPKHLKILGRVHDAEQAISAVEMAKSAGLENINLDLMYCLPQQTPEHAHADLQQAIALVPAHISAYHLTIEPQTLFAKKPPVLPDESVGWEIQQLYWSTLANADYRKYEISAYAKPGCQCRHNLNYWRFGDYLGIGAGAHGKVTAKGKIYRTQKPRHPERYMQVFTEGFPEQNCCLKFVPEHELPLEYMMNKLRLQEPFSVQDYQQSTGLDFVHIHHIVDKALALGLLDCVSDEFQVSPRGRLFLDDLLQLFLVEDTKELLSCYG